MKRIWAIGLGLPTLAVAGVWVLTPEAALKAWGHGFIDQRIAGPSALTALDDALDLRLDGVQMDRPGAIADLSAPLVERWQAKQDLRFHLGPTYADGVRAVHVEYACPPSQKGERCGISTQAKPVACPASHDAEARCYHVPLTGFAPIQFHAAVTLEATKGGWVQASGSVLALVTKADALRGALHTSGLGGLLEKIDGLSIPQGLDALQHKADLDADYDGAAEGWGFEFSFQAGGQVRSERAPVEIATGVFATARAGGDACPVDAVGAAVEDRLPELFDACFTRAKLSREYLYWGELDGDGVVKANRPAGGYTQCVDATISGWALPVHGSACTVDLVVDRRKDRPWRWTSGRPVASRQKAGHE
ncbi:MAG: hypothetical protein KC613_27645 [Myxococcales bacterium]|nr:hypothetical protein [Myxococcales bacterium]